MYERVYTEEMGNQLNSFLSKIVYAIAFYRKKTLM